MRVSLVICGIALASGAAVGSDASAEGTCQALPPGLQASYHRPIPRDGYRVTLGECTFVGAHDGRIESRGEYTVTGGDDTSGVMVLSNDTGCRRGGNQDLPTSYGYRVEDGRLTLSVEGGSDADRCPVRATVLTHFPWVKTISGRVAIVYDKVGANDRGRFAASGVVRETGTFTGRNVRRDGVVTHIVTLTGTRGTIVVTERTRGARSTWSVTGATGDYSGAAGGGSETKRARGNRVHVVMTGRIST